MKYLSISLKLINLDLFVFAIKFFKLQKIIKSTKKNHFGENIELVAHFLMNKISFIIYFNSFFRLQIILIFKFSMIPVKIDYEKTFKI